MTRRFYSKALIVLATIILATLLITWFPVYANAADKFSPGEYVRVNVDTYLNFRAEPKGEIIGQLPDNELVEIIGKRDRDGYYKIRIVRNWKEGYVYGEYLEPLPSWDGNNWAPKPTATPTPHPTAVPTYSPEYTVSTMAGLEVGSTLVVKSNLDLNFRTGPGRNYKSFTLLKDEAKLVSLTDRVINSYVYVQDPVTGYTGYVDQNYVVVYTAPSNGQYCTCPCCIKNRCTDCQQW